MLTGGFLKCIDLIDKTTHEIHQDADKVTYTSLDEIADDLPDHAPRFILLSYPLTTVSPMSLPFRAESICHIPIYIFSIANQQSHYIVRRTVIRALRSVVLPPHHMQRRDEDALRRRQGADTQHGRGEQGY